MFANGTYQLKIRPFEMATFKKILFTCSPSIVFNQVSDAPEIYNICLTTLFVWLTFSTLKFPKFPRISLHALFKGKFLMPKYGQQI